MSEKQEKLVIIATHGTDDPERATLPFVMGNAALVMDVQTTIMLQGTAVFLAKGGCYEHVFAAGLPPLSDLVKSFVEQGGKILVCTPCIRERKIDESMLLDIAEPIAAGRAVQECVTADAVLNY